jgi:hypothetical protein
MSFNKNVNSSGERSICSNCMSFYKMNFYIFWQSLFPLTYPFFFLKKKKMYLLIIFLFIFLMQSQINLCLNLKLDYKIKALHPLCIAEKNKAIQKFHSSRTLYHCLATFRCYINKKKLVQTRKGFYHAHILYPMLYHSKKFNNINHTDWEECIFPYTTLPFISNETIEKKNSKFLNIQHDSLFSGFPTVNTRQLIVFNKKKKGTFIQTSQHICYQRSTQFLDFLKTFHTCALHQPTYLSFIYDKLFEKNFVTLQKKNIFVQFINLFKKNNPKSQLTFFNLIGAGGESEVWRACRSYGNTADIVAIKVIRQLENKERVWNVKKARKRIKLSVSDSFDYLNILPSDLFHLPQEILTLSDQKYKHLEVFKRSFDSTKVLYNYHVLVYELATQVRLNVLLKNTMF